MTRQALLRDALGWGFALWLFGYALSIVLFAVVPASLLGWVIMPVGIAATLWVLLKRIGGATVRSTLLLGLVWTALAVVLDYVFIVQLFRPADGYYKVDVYLYYLLTFLLPVIVGRWKHPRARA